MTDSDEWLPKIQPVDPPEGWEGCSYWPRSCYEHWHVTCCGDDLIGGYCKTEEEAAEKCRRLNDGEPYEEVMGGNWMELAMRELGWTDPEEK